MAYNIAMIGTGYIASKHCSVLESHPDAFLHTLCSTERSKLAAQELAEKHRFRAVTVDYGSVLNDPDLDIIFICTPDQAHPDQVTAALQAGKHVFCEKPLARTQPEFKVIRSLLKSSLVLQVGMNCRFREQYAIPKAMTQSNELGDLRFIRGTYLYNMVQSIHAGEKKWSLDYPQGVYPFLHGGGIHCLDLMRWIGGEVRTVFARAAAFELVQEYGMDTFSISLEFRSGVLGELLASSSAFRPNEFELELWFRHGSIVGRKIFNRTGDHINLQEGEMAVAQKKLDLILQYEDMVQAIESHQEPLNSFDEAYENFVLTRAIEQSIREKREIYLAPQHRR